MENRLLRYFIVVSNEENITNASKILHISQPALSKAMMDLENELKVKLFTRDKNHLSLTSDGMILKKRALEILDLVYKTEEELKHNDEIFKGHISIGLGESNASKFISDVIKKINIKYPNIKFELFSATADYVKEKINNGLLDFGVIVGDENNILKYHQIKLPVTDKWGLLVSKESKYFNYQKITPSDLKEIKLFVTKRAFNQKLLIKWLGSEFDQNNIVGTYNLVNNVAELVKNNIGQALVIDGCLSFLNDEKLKFIPLAPEVIMNSTLIYKNNPSNQRIINKFVEEVENLSNNYN